MITYTYSKDIENILGSIDEAYNSRLKRLACAAVDDPGCIIMVSKHQHESILSDPILNQLANEKSRILSLAIPKTIRVRK